MNLGDLSTSKYLKRSDVGPGVLVTIRRVAVENIAKEGADPEDKAILYFNELEKPMVLNSTNGHIIASINGQEADIENTWVGTQIVLYDNPNVSFGGKLVGGLRVRKPRVQANAAPPPVAPVDEGSDGLPF